MVSKREPENKCPGLDLATLTVLRLLSLTLNELLQHFLQSNSREFFQKAQCRRCSVIWCQSEWFLAYLCIIFTWHWTPQSWRKKGNQIKSTRYIFLFKAYISLAFLNSASSLIPVWSGQREGVSHGSPSLTQLYPMNPFAGADTMCRLVHFCLFSILCIPILSWSNYQMRKHQRALRPRFCGAKGASKGTANPKSKNLSDKFWPWGCGCRGYQTLWDNWYNNFRDSGSSMRELAMK